jgi:hypothetical protein
VYYYLPQTMAGLGNPLKPYKPEEQEVQRRVLTREFTRELLEGWPMKVFSWRRLGLEAMYCILILGSIALCGVIAVVVRIMLSEA